MIQRNEKRAKVVSERILFVFTAPMFRANSVCDKEVCQRIFKSIGPEQKNKLLLVNPNFMHFLFDSEQLFNHNWSSWAGANSSLLIFGYFFCHAYCLTISFVVII